MRAATPERVLVSAQPVYAGLWSAGSTEQIIVADRTNERFDADVAGFATRMRITALTSYAGDCGRVYRTAAYEPGTHAQTVLLGRPGDTLLAEHSANNGDQLQLTALSAYVDYGAARYDAVYEPGGRQQRLYLDLPLAQLGEVHAAEEAAGWHLAGLHTVTTGNGPRCAALFEPMPAPQVLRLDRPWRRFLTEYAELREQGFGLAELATSHTGEGTRYHAVYDHGTLTLLSTDDPAEQLIATHQAMLARGYRLRHLLTEKVEALDLAAMAADVQARAPQASVSLAAGPSRRPACADRVCVGAVSNTVTAAAILQLLGERGLTIDTPITAYLPSAWQVGPNMDSVTFRHLLTHTAGLRAADAGLAALRAQAAAGIVLSDRTFAYRDENFALLRLLVPYLDGFDDTATPDLAAAANECYLSYLARRVFSPIGVADVTGDAAGLYLSADELTTFLSHLRRAGTLLSAEQRALMIDLDLGWQGRSPVRHGEVSEHGAPSTLICSFSVGVDVAVTLAAPAGGVNLRQAVIEAYRTAWTTR